MKVQCSCGAKFVFDITAEMKSNPVRFVCPACGTDSSEFVDGLIRKELGQTTTPGARVVTVEPRAEGLAETSAQPAAPLRIRLQASSSKAPPSTGSSETTGAVAATPPPSHPAEGAGEMLTAPRGSPCLKHPGQFATDKCYICSKPLCPKCMELFGYVCSPLCRAKADSHGIEIPVYAGQRSVAEARLWRKVGWLGAVVGILLLGGLGFWFWYAWFGLAPKTILAVRFPEAAYSGQSALAGKDQVVFLHGGLLARYDLHHKTQVWSNYLLDTNQIQTQLRDALQRTKAAVDKANMETPEHVPKMPDPDKLTRQLERSAAAELELRVRGEKIWVITPSKLTRYDFNSGKTAQEIAVPEGAGPCISRGEELLLMEEQAGKPAILRINLNTCDSRTIDLSDTSMGAPAKPASPPPAPSGSAGPKAGLPVGVPGKDAGKPMDPAKVAEQAQHISWPGRIALPAVLANSWSQERMLSELDDTPRPKTPAATPTGPAKVEQINLIPTKNGLVEFSVRLLERHIISRSAINPRASKSVLEGPVGVTQTSDVANEMLNEMQRERGGDVVQEDESRYGVKLRRPGVSEVWTGEVIGRPVIFPLQSVLVLAANKKLVVFDKDNRKVWEASLTYNIPAGQGALEAEDARYGQGPCVEFKDALFVFDQGVLTAFDLKTGNVRWRLPSVGITGLFFDDQGMMYVNSTTANADSIRFSRQININQKAVSVILKMNPVTHKILWSAQPGGLVNYVSGKYIYTIHSYAPEEEEENPYVQETGFETPPYVRIKRINPRNGREMWEHFQQRAPVDVEFDKDIIRLVFKKEVQVLKCSAF